MKTELTFRVDTGGLTLLRSVPGGLEKVMGRAGTDALRGMKAEASRRIRARKRVKITEIDKTMRLIYPTRKEASQLQWALGIMGEVMPAASFPYRRTKQGVVVEINVGKRALIRHAFVATMKSGHTGIFLRKGQEQLPIKEAFTSRVLDPMLDPGAIEGVQARGQKVFGDAFVRLVPLELAKILRR